MLYNTLNKFNPVKNYIDWFNIELFIKFDEVKKILLMFNDFCFIIIFKIIMKIIIFIDKNRKVFPNKITFNWKLCFIISFIFDIYSKKFIEIRKLNFWITLVQFRFFWPRFSQNVLLFEKHFFISIKNYVFNNMKLTRKCYSKKWKNNLGYFPEILGIFHVFFVEIFYLKKHIFPKKFSFFLDFWKFLFLVFE